MRAWAKNQEKKIPTDSLTKFNSKHQQFLVLNHQSTHKMFTYTSLVPEGNTTRAALLEFDGVRILADPGWDGRSDLRYLDNIISTVDMIILSHPTTDFLGAYAYLAFHDLKIPVYATLPACNLGRVATLDLYRSVGLIGPLKGTEFELKDVEEAFDKIITVKHSQTTDLRAKYDGLSLTAINGGHTLGGTIWVITKNSEKIIYAPEWNHSKDSFLNGADLLQNSTLLRPSVIITSTAIGSVLPHKKRVEKFFELVDATLGRGGTVLLPTSIGGRMLELVHLIDDHLQSAPIPVLLLSHTKARNLTYAGSMLEWMAPAVIRDWESRGQPPFDSSRVQVVQPNELLNLPGAKVVFASGAGFEDGSVAQAALTALCSDEKTSIILTERVPGNSIGNDLFFAWESLAKANGKLEDGVPVAFQNQLTVKPIREDALVGDELIEYQNHVKERRTKKEESKKAKQADTKETQFEDESESESEDEDILDVEKKKETIPIDVDVRNAKGRTKMFQFIPPKAKFDDYGEIINPTDYAREEEKDVNKLKRHKANNKVQIGEKKKWNEGKKQDDTSDLDALHEPKSRHVSQLIVTSRCVLSYIDLQGLVDIRSLSLIIPALKPKKVFLLSDQTDPSNFQKVASTLKKHNNFDVLELNPNEPVYSKDTVQSFDILLDEKLTDQLKWQKIAGGFTVAHVIGNVKTKKELEQEVKAEEDKLKEESGAKEESAENGLVKNEKDTNGGLEDAVETSRNDNELVLTPLEQDSTFLANMRATQLAIGDVKLSELKKSLSVAHNVEFKGEGTLVVDDIVAVRKISDGDVVVDGAPGKLFYEVRDAVRKMLAYV